MHEKLSPYDHLNAIYDLLPEPADPKNATRNRTIADKAELSITQMASTAQKAFIVSLTGISFYVSKQGLEWISLPDVKVSLPANSELQIHVPPFSRFGNGEERDAAAQSLVEWVVSCIQTNHLSPSPLKLNLA
ncbi:hypothetical protein HYU96_00205 [Candidatus Daviesbacteria bacterium]|nr:hypothetical protein [Candidatus Daviesbacteria bacterium]